MKILYVEDKPSENIDRIISLLRKYLSKDLVKQLEKVNEDESGFGASAVDIKQILNSSDTVWFEYNFYDALKAIKNNSEFALYVVDRNLSDSEYEVDDIKKIEPSFTEELEIEYVKFEGDYLLNRAAMNKIDILHKFYFLTANPSDDIRNIERIKLHFDFEKFSTENFIDKTDTSKIEKLRNIINSHSVLQIQHENRIYLNLLKTHIGENAVKEFIKLLVDKNLQINDALISLRRLLQNILTALAKKKRPPAICWNQYKEAKGKDEIELSKFIYEIVREDPLKYNTNIVIETALYNFKQLLNDEGAHTDFTIDIEATKDTVQSLIYNLKDIILWFGKIVNN